MNNDLMTRLLQALDGGAALRSLRSQYLAGNQPMAYLAPEAREALGTRFGRMSTNLPRLAVNSLAERLRVTGFLVDGAPDAQLWADWMRSDLDQMAPVAHREALALGESFVIVWGDAAGNPQVTVESPAQAAVLRDPASREVVAAVKRWTLAGGKGTDAVLFEPDQITRMHSDAIGATTGFVTSAVIPNPFGIVPVVPLRNTETLLGAASSEIDDLAPLVDALNKLLADLMVSSEYTGRPRRWASGIELVEADVLDADGNPTGQTAAVNPYPEGNRMMITESPEARFGQLDATDLAGYEAAVRVLQAQISAVSGLPPHYLGVHGDQPASADALRASEAALTARAESRQATFGRGWEAVARLMVATRTGADPASVDVRVQWADPSTRSIAQEADAVVKLFGAGLLPASYALARLGYSDSEVAAIRQARRAEALDTAGTNLDALLSRGGAA